MGFAKLDDSILDSSVWTYDSDTRVVWITLLAMKRRHGIVKASVSGIAHRARLPVDVVQKALDVFMAPDPDDKSGVDEGRRVRKIAGGFLVVNHDKWRGREAHDDAAADRMARVRRRRSEAQSRGEPQEAENEAAAPGSLPYLWSIYRRGKSAVKPWERGELEDALTRGLDAAKIEAALRSRPGVEMRAVVESVEFPEGRPTKFKGETHDKRRAAPLEVSPEFKADARTVEKWAGGRADGGSA